MVGFVECIDYYIYFISGCHTLKGGKELKRFVIAQSYSEVTHFQQLDIKNVIFYDAGFTLYFLFVLVITLQVITIGRHVKGYHYIIANLVCLQDSCSYSQLVLSLTFLQSYNTKFYIFRVSLMGIYPKSSTVVPTCQDSRLLISMILWYPSLISDGRPLKKRSIRVQTAK